MTKTFYHMAGSALICLVAIGCGSKQGGSSTGNLALVNGDPITMDEFHAYLERKQKVQVIAGGQPVEGDVVGTLSLQAMRDLINRKILMQIAKDEKIAPTPKDITDELAFQKKKRGDFVKQLQLVGLTMDQIRTDLALDLARDRIEGKGITVKEAEVDEYIKTHPKSFVTPAQASVYWILVRKTEDKKLVDQDLSEGQRFKQVAIHYSQAPNAQRSEGQYTISNIEQMPPRLQAIVARTPLATPTEWFQDGSNYVKFYIERKEAEKKVPITDVTREMVRRAIRQERGRQGLDLSKRLQTKLRNAKIEVQVEYLRAPWTQAFDAMKVQDSQDKQSESSTTNTPAGN